MFRLPRISPTLVRAYVATELASMTEENLDTVSQAFLKNRPNTLKRYYIGHFYQRESVRLSMKIFGDYSKEFRRPVLCNDEDVKNWLHANSKKIKNDFGETIDDSKLLKMVKGMLGPLYLSYIYSIET